MAYVAQLWVSENLQFESIINNEYLVSEMASELGLTLPNNHNKQTFID